MIKCDKCGADGAARLDFGKQLGFQVPIPTGGYSESIDLCPECRTKLAKLVTEFASPGSIQPK
jgi:hypothetical protein